MGTKISQIAGSLGVVAATFLGVSALQDDELFVLPLVEVSAVERADGSIVADSFRITARWQPVVQKDGALVPFYDFRFLRSDTVACHFCTGTTGVTTISRVFAFPVAGDSAIYRVEVRARDSHNIPSPYASSIPIVVKGEAWTPPPPPVVTIDTIGVALEEADSLEVWAYFEDGVKLYGSMTTPLYLVLGDSIQDHAQLCAWAWKDGVRSILEGQPAVCNWGGVGMSEFGLYLGQRQT